MKILFLTYDIPWPLDSGGKIRAYNLIRYLSKSHNVTLVSFCRDDEQLKHLESLKQVYRAVILVKRKHKLSPYNLIYLPFLPYPAALYYHPNITQLLLDEIAMGSYDLVHFESFYTSPYIQYISNVPTVLGTENIEWRVYDEYAQTRSSKLIRSFLNFEVSRVKRFEKESWKTADMCLAVSDENASEISKVTKKTVPVVRNGVDPTHFKYVDHTKQTKTLLFVGNFAYIQNQDSAEWIAEKIAPLISQKATLRIIGRNPTREIQSLDGAVRNNISIKVDSNVDDIRTAFENADVMLAPIRVGSGTKFKILEAMASGLSVVTNAVGIEGIPAEQGKDVIIATSEKELAHETDVLLENPQKRTELAKSARQFVERTFSWESIGKTLEQSYRTLLSSSS